MIDYKASRYIIVLDDEEKKQKIIYSLRSAHFAVLSNEQYSCIFERNTIFGSDEKLLHELVEKKILIDFQTDELKELKELCQSESERYNNGPTTHYIITPTMECNARCYYCFERGAHHKTMSESVADAVTDFMIKQSCSKPISIYWYGGEPLMAPHIIDRISNTLRSNNIDFSSRITSNGYFLNQDMIQKAIKDWNVEMIQIPIDDIGNEYNRIKNYKKPCVDDPFSLIMENIGVALSSGLFVRVRINFHPENIQLISKICDYICEKFDYHPKLLFHIKPIGADNIPWMTELPWSGENSLETYYNLLNRYVNNRKGAEKKVKFKKTCILCNSTACVETSDPLTKLLRDFELLPKVMNCEGITNRALAIDSCGSLYVCHLLLGQDPSKYSDGTIFTGILGNELTIAYRNLDLNKECESCLLLPVCQGGCRYREYRYIKKENKCVMYKYHLKELMQHIVQIAKYNKINLN